MIGLVACGDEGAAEQWTDDDPAALVAASVAASTGSDAARKSPAVRAPSDDVAAGVGGLPPPKVRSFVATGTGCPTGTRNEHALDARGRSRVDLSSLESVSTPSPAAEPKTCKLSFDLVKPAGFGVALRSFRVIGRANLPAGKVGQVKVTTAVGSSIGSPRYATLGALEGPFEFTHVVRDGEQSVSSCRTEEGPVEIVVSTAVSRAATTTVDAAPDASGRIQVESLRDIEFVFTSCDS